MSEPYVTIMREIESDPNSFALLVIASWCGKTADELERLQAEVQVLEKIRQAHVDELLELKTENERLREAMVESYEPGCECPCCEIVRSMYAAVQEKYDE